MTLSQNTRPRTSGSFRVWIIENGASPKTAPSYQGCLVVSDLSRSFGDVTPIYKPSAQRYNQWEEVGVIRGERERATFSMEGYLPSGRSDLLRIANRDCSVDVQIIEGTCNDPTQYDSTWQRIIILEAAYITSHSPTNLGSLNPGDQDVAQESVEASARDYYEVIRLTFQQSNNPNVPADVAWTSVYGYEECIDCNFNLPGCETVFYGDTAGNLFFTTDANATMGTTSIPAPVLAGNTVTSGHVVGENVFILTSTNQILYANAEDIATGVEEWLTIDGFVGTPTAIAAESPQDIWVADDQGYVYQLNNTSIISTAQVALNPFTSITIYNCACIAIGDNQGNVYTTENQGETWSEMSVTSPAGAAASNINALYIIPNASANAHSSCGGYVAATDIGVFCTNNNGASWRQVPIPIQGTINGFTRATRSVLFAYGTRTNGDGFLLRSTNGGNTWYTLPDKPSTRISNLGAVSDVAVCSNNPNLIYFSGTATSGSGIWKGAGRQR